MHVLKKHRLPFERVVLSVTLRKFTYVLKDVRVDDGCEKKSLRVRNETSLEVAHTPIPTFEREKET